ncbi:hypothetical protein PR202_gb04123 [Eleusine coracana subsp. coracana]|uniref:AB hydrolase-1 domain-containing protein n=1 Tax=Eleusine coracana subsp. coracana TaxID=191504 RepID=A0AAV5E199_ELECO|nr:hypothetical protein PR202_gb04123 [Eleusine coracana subsp. coracana]
MAASLRTASSLRSRLLSSFSAWCPPHLLLSSSVHSDGHQTETLAFDEIQLSPEKPPTATAFVLHGLLGSGRNWRSFSRTLASELHNRAPSDEWRMVLVDLRNHGWSAGIKGIIPPHDMSTAAKDLADLVKARGWAWPDVVVGHSMGGKVALDFAESCSRGVYGESAVLPKQNNMKIVKSHDVHLSVLVLERDYWPLLEHPPKGLEIAIVQAERSDRWDPSDVRRLKALSRREGKPDAGKVSLHVLPNSGHWVHVDNPKATGAYACNCESYIKAIAKRQRRSSLDPFLAHGSGERRRRRVAHPRAGRHGVQLVPRRAGRHRHHAARAPPLPFRRRHHPGRAALLAERAPRPPRAAPDHRRRPDARVPLPNAASAAAPPPRAAPLAGVRAPDFHALLEHELNRNPWGAEPDDASSSSSDSSDAPVLFATFYDLPPPDGGAALFVRIHTVACDRSAAAALARELVALLGGGEEREPEDAAAQAGLEERIPQRDTWKPFWARGMDMVGYSINGLRTSTLPFVETGTARSTQMLRLGLGRDDTTSLLDACKENGVKLCSAMAAATMLATRKSKQLESGQQETYSTVTLINCRKFLEPALDDHNVGFFYSAITNTHSVHGEEGLWELAKRCHDAYTGAKGNKKHLTDISDLNFLMCRAIENPQLTPSAALRTALISVFEEPVVTDDEADLKRKAGVEDCVCCATVHGIGPSIGVFDTVRDGRLECECIYPAPLHSRKQVQEIFDEVKRILLEASRASDENFEDCA